MPTFIAPMPSQPWRVPLAKAALLAVLLTLPACHHEPTPTSQAHSDHHPAPAPAPAPAPDHDHDHDHDLDRTIRTTAWSEGFEVFAEYQVPLRGEPTSFAIHVTHLGNGTPKTTGAILLQSQLPSGVRSEITLDNPQSPGLYVSHLTFPQGGDWSVKVVIPAAESAAAIELGEVRVYESLESVAHARIPAPPEGVVLLKEQQWRLGVLTRVVTRQSLIERRIVPGVVRPQPGTASNLRAPLEGRLLPLPESPPLSPGQSVVPGQLLALVEPTFSDLASQWAATEADWGRSRADLERFQAAAARLRSLVAVEARSPREWEEAEADLAAAQARFSATDQLRRSYRSSSITSTHAADSLNALEIRAPMAGVVHTLYAGPGDWVASGQALFDLADLDTVWIEARIPEFVVGTIPAPEDILVEVLDGSARVLPIALHHGQFLQLGVEVHPQQRTVPALYSWPNVTSQLRLGQRLRIHLATAHSRHSLAIPESAMVEDAGQSIAFVQLDGEIFQRRELQLGVRDGSQVEVLDGLQEGERIVTHGAVVLRLAGAVGNIPEHGHSH